MKYAFTLKYYPLRELMLGNYISGKKGNDVFYISFSKRWLNLAKKKFPEVKVYDFVDYSKRHEKEYCSKDLTCVLNGLKKYEKKYGFNLASILYCDRVLRDLTLEEQSRKLLLMVQFLDEIVSNESPDIVVGELSSAPDLFLYELSKIKNIAYLCPVTSKYPQNFVFTTKDDEWLGLDKEYSAYVNKGKLPSESLKTTSFEYLSKFKDCVPQPDFMKFSKIKIFDFNKFKFRLGQVLSKYRSYPQDKNHAIDYRNLFVKSIVRDVKFKFRYLWFKKINKFYSELKKENYLFFPLHFQPEFTSMTLAPFYENQLCVIESIVKILPADYFIYVKEHPAMVGIRDSYFYRRLKQLSRVRCVSPDSNQHSLIKNSRGILTLSGTAGWEGYLMGKPVITFGNVFYNCFKGVYQFKNWEDLKHELENIEDYYISEKDIYCALYAYFSTIIPGSYIDTKSDKSVLEQGNIKCIAESIIEYAKSR